MKKRKKNINTHPLVDPEQLRRHLMDSSKPGITNRIEFADDIIDLHMDQLQTGKGEIPATDILFHQLEEFERSLDKAMAAGKLEMRVIHGLGKGKLKAEIYKILEKHPGVRSYTNDYHSRYGFGSTLIQFN